jgi:indole-3-glycerol phosphate synthase
MMNFLNKLVNDADKRVREGYYDLDEIIRHKPISLSRQIKNASDNAVIAEIKPISPALGPLKPDLDAEDAALKLEQGGAIALSILTEPDNFGGSLTNLLRVRQRTSLPILMKDIIIDKKQITAARECGADCVLLIQSIFSEIKFPSVLDRLMTAAHELQLEVLLEIHNEREFQQAISSSAEIIGVNNRDLRTLEIDLQTTTRILTNAQSTRKTIISESGLETADDIRRIKGCVDGFLIGSSIMLSENPESKVREFVLA